MARLTISDLARIQATNHRRVALWLAMAETIPEEAGDIDTLVREVVACWRELGRLPRAEAAEEVSDGHVRRVDV